MTSDVRPLLPSRRIAEDLRAAITTGEYGPGDKLPSERDLAARYATARNTARQALTLLKTDGLITIEHGRGAFVRRTPRLIRLGAERYSHRLRRESGLSPFRAEARRLGRTPRVEVPRIARTTPPADVAERLGLQDLDDAVVERVNIYFLDDEPVQIGVTHIPWEIVADTVLATEAKTGHGSIYERLAELGHEITTTREEITARMPRPDEVTTLSIPPGVPVIELLHTGLDQHGRAFECTRFVLRADTSALDYRLAIDD